MKSNLSYETVKINKIIFNRNLEQTVDFEYQLPDYYTGIFKVLKFNLEPHINSCKVANKQLIIEGNSAVKILYIDEENGDIKSIHQNIPFSKTVNLEEDTNDAIVFYNAKTGYKNCKILSSKKIEIKATLNIYVKIQAQKEENILKNSNNNSVQLKNSIARITSNQIWTNQQFNINEQVEFDAIAKEILDVRINIEDDECKIITNKIISKSIAHIEILYCSEAKNSLIIQKTSIPINNIIDMPNINENYIYTINYDIISTNFEILQEGKFLNVEANVVINSYGNLYDEVEIVTDAFSTKYELQPITKEFAHYMTISNIDKEIMLKETIDNVNIYKLFDVTANITDLTYSQNDKNIEFKAKLNFNALGLSKEDTLETYSKLIPIEFKVSDKNIKPNLTNVNISSITLINSSSNLKDDNTLDVKLNFKIKGFISINETLNAVTDLNLDENKLKEKTKSALTLFYPKPGDEVWSIAKHFCTSPKAIMDANGLEEEIIREEVMLIIPIM